MPTEKENICCLEIPEVSTRHRMFFYIHWFVCVCVYIYIFISAVKVMYMNYVMGT